MKSEKKIKKIEENILEVALKIAKDGEGALFVIADKLKYKRLMKQKFKPFSIFSPGSGKLLRSLAVIDGAVIITSRGIVKDYGVLIKSTKTFRGFGTRHSAAISASENENISILCSEEERKVKIFKDGKYIMQMDALHKDVNKGIASAVSMLETIGAGTIGTIGVATLVPSLGISIIPGVIVFGGSYYMIKRILDRIR